MRLDHPTYQSPVYQAQRGITDEGEMYRCNTGTPHKEHDSTEVQLVAERGCLLVEVPDYMTALSHTVLVLPSIYSMYDTDLAEQAKQTATPRK